MAGSGAGPCLGGEGHGPGQRPPAVAGQVAVGEAQDDGFFGAQRAVVQAAEERGRPQSHHRRNQRPHRRRRGHGRLTTKPPPRTPKPRRNTTGGAFSRTRILTVNDAAIINLSVRGQRTRSGSSASPSRPTQVTDLMPGPCRAFWSGDSRSDSNRHRRLGPRRWLSLLIASRRRATSRRRCGAAGPGTTRRPLALRAPADARRADAIQVTTDQSGSRRSRRPAAR
jgi:hypothetical protein